MNPRFSFSDALFAPFGLLKQRPLHLFVWGLLMVGLTAATYSIMIPIFAAIPFSDGSEAAMDVYTQEVTRFGAAINGMTLLMYLVMLMLWTAAGRAVLAPGVKDRFLFLRLGMDEVRVAVAIIAVFMGWYLAFLVLVLVGVGLGMALWAMNEAAAVGVLMIYGLAVFAGSIWILARASLIAPASLILKRFAFAEGWTIARGQVWKLIGLTVMVWVIYTLCIIVIYALVLGILAGGFVVQGLQWPTPVNSAADLEPLIQPMIAPAVLAGLVLAFGFGWVMTLYAAPHIVAARQLLDGAPMPADAAGADALQQP